MRPIILYVIALAGGILQALAFPFTNIASFSFIALIFLFIVTNTNGRLKQHFFYGFAWGFSFFSVLIYWIIETVHIFGKLPLLISLGAYLLLVVYLSLYPAIFALFIAWLFKKLDVNIFYNRLLLYLSLPSAWIILEQVRGNFMSGFPWGVLGYSLVSWQEMVQMAEFTSVYGVSFFIVLINVLIFFLIGSEIKYSGFKQFTLGKKEKFAILCLLFILIGGNYFMGSQLIKKYEAQINNESLKVGLLQGNISQEIKWNENFRDETILKYFKLQKEAIRSGAKLIIWPETSFPLYLLREDFFLTIFTNQSLSNNVYIIAGTPDYILEGQGNSYSITNTALFFRPDNLDQKKLPERYDKIHLVPFGEYVPLKKWLPFIDKLVEEVGNFRSGEGAQLFSNGAFSLSPFICFEIIFPEEVRNSINQGANLIVHITNDAWFGKTAAPRQHVEIVQMRSIENRVASVTAANTGISNIISNTGKVIKETKLMEETVLVGDVFLSTGERTFYGKNGLWLLYLSYGIILLTIIIVAKRKDFHT
ncbi:MAG: apolipoprotein N-acyltransferase [Nitrospinae bacterium]|nr:apolipoprotein N-acyltransferase [Nitrospinota bacterium]